MRHKILPIGNKWHRLGDDRAIFAKIWNRIYWFLSFKINKKVKKSDRYNPRTMEKREAILTAVLAGTSTKDIMDTFGVSRKTIYNVKRDQRERGTLQRKPGSGRRPTVVTTRLVNIVKSRVARNPIRTIRGMAREVGVAETSMRRAVRKAGYRSNARSEKFLLTERLKAARLEKAKVLLNLLKKKTPIILFTDEKYFTVDPVASSRTARDLTKGRARDVADNIRVVQKTKHPSQIMVFGLVTSDGRKIDPIYGAYCVCHPWHFPIMSFEQANPFRANYLS